MRVAAAIGFLQMKRWGHQWMVVTCWMGVVIWCAYVFNMTMFADVRYAGVVFPGHRLVALRHLLHHPVPRHPLPAHRQPRNLLRLKSLRSSPNDRSNLAAETANPTDDLPPGTTPYYARMHKWIKRAVLVCLVALVIEGAFTLAVHGRLLRLPDAEPHSDLQRAAQDPVLQRHLGVQVPLPAARTARRAPKARPPPQDVWGIQPTPEVPRLGFRELVRIHDERIARQSRTATEQPASMTARGTSRVSLSRGQAH